MRRIVTLVLFVVASPALAVAQCIDIDGDGYGNPASAECVHSSLDCNDASPSTYPGAYEACDGFDNNCDGQLDDDPACEPECTSPIRLAAPILVTSASGLREYSAVTWAGSVYGIAWTDYRHEGAEIYFRLVDALGYPIGSESRISDALGSSSDPALVFNGTEFGLAWTDERDGNPEIYFVRLSPTGTKLANEIRLTNNSTQSADAALVWDGVGYAIAWTQNYAIQFMRLDRNGEPIGASLGVSERRGVNCSLAATDTEYGVTWIDSRDGNDEIYFQRVSSTGTRIGQNVRVTSAPGSVWDPSLAWNGAEYRLAWQDYRFGYAEVLFARLDVQGAKLLDDVRVTNAPDPDFRASPALEWSGREYAIVAYSSRSSRLYLSRISEMGELVGGELDLGATGLDRPAIAWSGREYGISFRTGAINVAFLRVGCDCAPDGDGDSYKACQGDCNDTDDTVWPGAPEVCDGQDNDCDAAIDEDTNGEDIDGDGVDGACDNCSLLYNADQRNEDGDALGNACDNCTFVPNDDQQDSDDDARGDACDNCPWSYNPLQDDLDQDRVGDACDNCVSTRNESQHDLNEDGEGDECDLDDGVVIFRPIGRPRVRWQSDPAYLSYNLYRGSLAVLRATEEYTQEPGANPYADRFCGLTLTYQDDGLVPADGEAFYWLATGVGAGGEEPLGDGAGIDRPNSNPCP